MTNIQAAVGCAQMERLEEFVNRKREIRRFYASAFDKLKNVGISFFPETKGRACWFSGIVLPEGRMLEDDRQISALLKEKGIESRTFWKPVNLQKPYKNVPRSAMAVTESLWDRTLTLPCSTGITDEELRYVVRLLYII